MGCGLSSANRQTAAILTPIKGTKSTTKQTGFCHYHEKDIDSQASKKKLLTIIHFNDVYNIEARDEEPVGGAARFVSKIKTFGDDSFVLFSGDCLNPSMSKIFTLFFANT